VDVPESRRGLGDVAEAQEVVARLAVDLGPEAREGQECLHLARERPRPGVAGIEQRLHSEAIAGEQQPRAPPVVDREGEDARELLDQPLAVLFVEMHQHFGVGTTVEAVAAGLEECRQGAVVVDLPVVHDIDAAVLIGHRLQTRGREVDQRQAAVHQVAVLVRPVALAVGTAVRQQGRGARGPPGLGSEANGIEAPG